MGANPNNGGNDGDNRCQYCQVRIGADYCQTGSVALASTILGEEISVRPTTSVCSLKCLRIKRTKRRPRVMDRTVTKIANTWFALQDTRGPGQSPVIGCTRCSLPLLSILSITSCKSVGLSKGPSPVGASLTSKFYVLCLALGLIFSTNFTLWCLSNS